jgi:ATP-dependent RNA helicase DeaD
VKPPGVLFADLGLRPEVMRAVEEMGFKHAMDVQAATIPLVRQGKDLMVQSRTGSGKTAAFGIPFANDVVDPAVKAVQALVLLPTRELALQVASELARITAHLPITVAPIYGGAPMGRQVEILRAGAQIVCGTPGRILDHLRRGSLNFDRVRCAVLDECDEMLSMGFQEDIEHILEQTPTARQTLLFSATVPDGIQRLSRRFLKSPEFLKLSADFVGVHEIRHVYYSIPGVNREQELLRILKFEDPKTAILFCNTREETGRIAEFLRKQGYEAEAISSDLGQSDRERVMALTRAGKVRFLVATDVAARGIDIEGLTHVFNYTFPDSPEVYIHRTGRTGRAGKHGTAISLIGPTEVGPFYYLKLLYKIKPEERALPSEAEIRSHREGERVIQLRGALQATGEPNGEWRSLARRLMGAIDGEPLVASLLARAFSSLEGMPAAPVPPPPPPVVAPVAARPARPERPRERDDRPRSAGSSYASASSSSSGDRGRPPRRDREEAPRRGRPERERGREPSRERPAVSTTASAGAPRPAGAEPDKEFWEVWGEERAQRPPASPPSPVGDAAGAAPSAASVTPPAPSIEGQGQELPADGARLYLNLGRKDGAGVEQIRGLLRDFAGIVDENPSIDVMNTHTYLNVATADADRICAALTGKQLGERDLVCERARPRRR